MFAVKSDSRSGLSAGVRWFLNCLTPYFEALVWLMFVFSLVVAFVPGWVRNHLEVAPLLTVDGLVRVIWPYVTLLTGILLNYSRRYMAGNHRLGYFFFRCFLFLVSVLVLAATDQMLIFLLAWLSMGWFIAGLIAHKIDWAQARAAGRLALQYFLASTLYLCVGVLVLYHETGTVVISEGLDQLGRLTTGELNVVFVCFMVAAVVQSALFPVQNWLMSSMTAPTPASALMHAGFVNAGGILLTRFSRIFVQETNFMMVLIIVGGLSAMMGKIWKMVQTAIKRQLGCSTIAQMGFMLLQCGLGYFSAAITHLILHGFYKGHLFLSSGNAVDSVSPKSGTDKTSTLVRNAISVITGLAAGLVFVLMTGKGLHFNSGLFLAFIVVLTILHGSREIVNRTSIPGPIRHGVFPVVALAGTITYSLIFNLITFTLKDLPQVVAPTPFTWVHALVALGFLALWIAVEAKLLKQSEELYVRILNASQPHPATVLSSKEEYHV